MKFKILGNPLATQSTQFTKKGFSYKPKKVKDWTGQARSQIILQLPEGFTPFMNEVYIQNLEFVFPVLTNFPKYKLKYIKEGGIIYKNCKPDIDNLMKLWADSIEGILFLKDSQIVEYRGFIRKKYGFIPRIEFEIGEIKQCIPKNK